MNRPPSAGPPSIYSHTHTSSGTRSRTQITGLRSRSGKSVRVPWYKRPLVNTFWGYDVQKLSIATAAYSVFLSLFTAVTSAFDIYCLSEATPGSTHYGYYLISFDFVYIGNVHVRNSLITVGVLSLLGGVILFITTFQLLQALRNEYEKQMIPWLVSMLSFSVWKLLTFVYAAVVNDIIFSYNIVMCLIWIVLTILNFGGWSSVYSLYLELCDLTKLEDIAHLRMGTMASISHSIAGSRPMTPISPHSTASTMQLPP